MKLIEKIKEKIIVNQITKKNKQEKFDVLKAENYELPPNSEYKNINSYYFLCTNNIDIFTYVRIAYRGNNSVECWLYYQKNNIIYYLDKHVYDINDNIIKIEQLENGRRWLVSYKGLVKKEKYENNLYIDLEEEEVSYELVFDECSKIFNFQTDLNPIILGKALSKEKWNKEFRNRVKENEQVHYEQMGIYSLSFKSVNYNNVNKCIGIRDHSYGVRVWDYMNRHIWIMMLISENEFLNINMVSYPHMKYLMSGYYYNNGVYESLKYSQEYKNIISSDTNLFEFKCESSSGTKFSINANRKKVVLYKFEDEAYTLHEGVGEFNYKGTIIKGIIELGYNKNKERWKV